ncbi:MULTISPECIES: transposase [unclassified Clostridium]|nr:MULTISPECIES: transposase [unclassified Clostridium]
MKSKIAIILKNHWEEFLKLYGHRVRKNVKREVEKVLECGDLSKGYIEFKCHKCNESKKVAFTCKSRFCTSCGKIYVDNWIENMLGKLINVRHRHIVFTIPEELREIFQRERNLLKLLPQCAAKTVLTWHKDQNKKESYTPGIVTVIHTFGRDLKWNPHVHMMVTEGGAGKENPWKHIRHFPYEMLRKRWQKLLLYALIDECKDKKKMKELKNKLYSKHDNGFYVHARNEIKSAKVAAKYVGRYVGRPAIAESRILAYDGKFVTFKYTRHEDNKRIVEKVHVYEFIKKLIVHIPDKNFKMIRYFGLYTSRNKLKDNLIKMLDKRILDLKKSIRRWEYRILASFGVEPRKCPVCGESMIFYDIVYKNYGSIRGMLKDKFINEASEKLEKAIEDYAMVKGIIYGRIKPVAT